MDKVKKEQVITELKDKFSRSKAAFLGEYRGLTVPQLEEVRNKVRAGDGELRILKNRIAKIAAKGTEFEELSKSFTGPIAIAFSYEDPTVVAKAFAEAAKAKDNPFVLKPACLQGKVMDEASVVALSQLPDKQTMRSMFVGTLSRPLQNFLGVMTASQRDFVGVLTALKDKKEA